VDLALGDTALLASITSSRFLHGPPGPNRSGVLVYSILQGAHQIGRACSRFLSGSAASNDVSVLLLDEHYAGAKAAEECGLGCLSLRGRVRREAAYVATESRGGPLIGWGPAVAFHAVT
jgi:hypothetical protein